VKSTVFCVVMPCNLERAWPSQVRNHQQQAQALDWRWCVPVKCQAVSELHIVTAQKTALFIILSLPAVICICYFMNVGLS
jgi:hypothetical protein